MRKHVSLLNKKPVLVPQYSLTPKTEWNLVSRSLKRRIIYLSALLFWFSFREMYSIYMLIIWTVTAVLSLTLNIFCLLAIRQCTKLKGVSRACLTSMTIADLGISIVFVVPAIASSVTGDWPFGQIVGALQVTALVPCFYGSIFSLVAVNIDRYISVEFPLKHLTVFTVKKARLCIITFYCLCIVFAIICGSLANWKVVFVQQHQLCVLLLADPFLRFLWLSVPLILMVIGVIVVMAIYVRLMYISRAQNGQIGAHRNSVSPKRDKSSTTFFIITLSMMVGYFPNLILYFIQVTTNVSVSQYVVIATRVCFASNGWWNVLIYYKRNKFLRKSFNRIVRKTFCLSTWRSCNI